MEVFLIGLVGAILNFPLLLKAFIEVLIVFGIVLLLWPILKYIPIAAFILLKGINKILLGGGRLFICNLGRKSHNTYHLDEQIGKKGNSIDQFFSRKIAKIKRSNRKWCCKKLALYFIILYLLLVLPVFKLERFLDEYYIEKLYFINAIVADWEEPWREKASNYPSFFKRKEIVKETEKETEKEVETEIYIELNDETAYANVRSEANMNGGKTGVISREDMICYLNLYEYDGERYWLKVRIETQNDLEGWISTKVIAESVLKELKLSE